MTILYKDGGKLTYNTIFLENGFVNADDLYSIPIDEIGYICDDEEE